jgi:hypothetical protein
MSFQEFYESDQSPVAPAVFIGIMGQPKFHVELFNLTQVIGQYPIGATVTRPTLEALGYFVPQIPEGTPKNTALQSLVTEAFTKKNPFNLKKPKDMTPKPSKLPRKTFKREMKQKMERKDMLTPRNWQVNRFGKLMKIFTK